MQRRHALLLPLALSAPWARAHHGWSSFDLDRPIWLEGRASKVSWRNPHAELELEVPADLRVPADLAQRRLPAQAAAVDGPKMAQGATVPRRKDRRWQIELAPLSRMQAWKVAPIQVGDALGMLGFTFAGEKGDAILRVEYLFVGDQVYGLRSSPA